MNITVHYGFKGVNFAHKNSAYKKGMSLVEAGHVFNVAEHNQESKTIIKARVTRQTSINRTPYHVTLEVSNLIY